MWWAIQPLRMVLPRKFKNRRTRSRSATSMTAVSWSGSTTTRRPPGRVTRTISARASRGAARCWKVRTAWQPSKASSAKPRWPTSATTNLTGRPAASLRRCASLIIDHRIARSDAHGPPLGSDKPRQSQDVIAGAATDVQDPISQARSKLLGNAPFVGTVKGRSVLGIEAADEPSAIVLPIHVGEAAERVSVVHHDPFHDLTGRQDNCDAAVSISGSRWRQRRGQTSPPMS